MKTLEISNQEGIVIFLSTEETNLFRKHGGTEHFLLILKALGKIMERGNDWFIINAGRPISGVRPDIICWRSEDIYIRPEEKYKEIYHASLKELTIIEADVSTTDAELETKWKNLLGTKILEVSLRGEFASSKIGGVSEERIVPTVNWIQVLRQDRKGISLPPSVDLWFYRIDKEDWEPIASLLDE